MASEKIETVMMVTTATMKTGRKKMRRNSAKRGIVFMATLAVLTAMQAFGAHPLITDDTGTQGKGGFQLEANSEYSYDKESADGVTVRERSGEVSATFSAGISESVDLVVGYPWQWSRVEENGEVVGDVDGPGDVAVELKWRLYERDGLSFALKPGVTLPSGNEERGLGSGRSSYGVTFITSHETEKYTVHMNLAYSHSDFRLDGDRDGNRADIFHGSVAGGVNLLEGLQLVTNVGAETNGDKSSRTWPAFALAGAIYSITEDVDVDLGVKWGLNKPETDATMLAGLAVRF